MICKALVRNGENREPLRSTSWSQIWPKFVRLFYVQRYERPQKGRHREFTQIGVELLGGSPPDDNAEVASLLGRPLELFLIQFEMKDGIRRGPCYYVEDVLVRLAQHRHHQFTNDASGALATVHDAPDQHGSASRSGLSGQTGRKPNPRASIFGR